MSASRSATPFGTESEPTLGPVITADGVQFNVFSSADRVELVLFDGVDDERPARVLELERQPHLCGRYWHRFVAGIRAGQIYGYRADGPFAPERGLRFDREKLLLDPYARCIERPRGRARVAAASPGDNLATALRCAVVDSSAYDWEEDRPPRVPDDRTVIYEMHVGHFTGHPSSGIVEALRGTFAGVMQKLPYLNDLGVSTVELMPVFAFDVRRRRAARSNGASLVLSQKRNQLPGAMKSACLIGVVIGRGCADLGESAVGMQLVRVPCDSCATTRAVRRGSSPVVRVSRCRACAQAQGGADQVEDDRPLAQTPHYAVSRPENVSAQSRMKSTISTAWKLTCNVSGRMPLRIGRKPCVFANLS